MASAIKTLLKTGCIASFILCSSAMANNYQLYLVRHAEKAAGHGDGGQTYAQQLQAWVGQPLEAAFVNDKRDEDGKADQRAEQHDLDGGQRDA